MASGSVWAVLLSGALALAALVHAAPSDPCPNTSVSGLQLSSCGELILDLALANRYSDRMCESRCTSDATKIRAANPDECTHSGVLLYADILTPLSQKCDMPPLPIDTMPPPITPRPPTAESTPTTPRPTDSPVTTSASPASTPSPSTAPSPMSTSADESGSAVPQSTQDASLTPSQVELADSSASNGSVPEQLPKTTTKPPRKTSAPSPLVLGSEDNSKTGTTQWVIVAAAVSAVVMATTLWVYRRCQRSTARHKPSAGYATLDSPNGPGTTHTTSSKGTIATNDSDQESSLLSADLRSQIDAKVNSDKTLAAWRLHGTNLTDKQFLGRGSHAFVHLVELTDGTRLASKRLIRGQATLANIEQLISEAHTCSTLQHHSIVAFVGVTWTSALDLQLLFKYMAGGDLRAYLDTHKPDPSSQETSLDAADGDTTRHSTWSPLKLKMALSVAEGLAYAHSFNPPLVHRDLKSRNILLTKDLQAKISDFGVARFLSENGTMTTGIGTNRWLAPEVLAGGGAYNETCDIYSFGVVLTELGTHEVPLANEMEVDAETGKKRTELSLMRAIARGELRPTVSASCPARLRDLATRCLSLDADDRPNALELSYRLRAITNRR